MLNLSLTYVLSFSTYRCAEPAPENYTYLESMEQNAYIKPADHELKKTRKFKKNIYHKDDMPYNAESDSFTCPNDKRLLHAYDRTGRTDNGCMIL